MQVILLEKIERLGKMGDVVSVKPGYARNYLLPREKALRATKSNLAYFEAEKKVLEADSAKRQSEAEKTAKKIEGITVAIVRQASEDGTLYGSVSARDIAMAISEKTAEISRSNVIIDRSYKMLGLYPVKISLHPEVSTTITLNIARSMDEAKIQEERGEALIVRPEDERAAAAAEKKAHLEAKAKKQEAKRKSKKTEEAVEAVEVAETEAE